MSDGPSLPLAPLPSFPLSDLTNTIFFSCWSVRYLAVATCPISSLSLPVRRTIDVGLSVSSCFSLASSFPSLITDPHSFNSSLSSPSTDQLIFLLTLLPTGHPAPRPLDQASRLPPTPRSGRWERGVGGSLARDLALLGGGRGGQLFPTETTTSVIQTHQPAHQHGGSRTRTCGDDLSDEAPNHPMDDLANHPADEFRRLRRRAVRAEFRRH